MPFEFVTHAMPLLIEMTANPLAEDYDLYGRAKTLGICADTDECSRLADLLIDDGYITAIGSKQANGIRPWVADVRPTTKALKQLELWPADDERALYLLQRVARALDAAADDTAAGDPAGSSERRAVAAGIREFGAEVLGSALGRAISGQ